MKRKLLLVSLTLWTFTISYSCKKNKLDEEKLTANISQKTIAINSNPNQSTTIGTNEQEFNELKDASQEGRRLRINYWNWTDFDPTGFYVPANTTLTLNVEQLAGTTLPKLLIGTYYRYKGTQSNEPLIVQLTAGLNTISSGQYGGMLWIRYTTTGTPTSKAKITFNSGHLRVPIFIKNQTTQADWDNQLATYTAPDVLLIGDRVYQLYSRTRAQGYQPQNNNAVLTTADRIWDLENYFTGIDGSATQHQPHVHNRILVTETDYTTGGGAAYAYYYGIYFTPNYCDEAFTSKIGDINGWSVWHEMGHQHQQDVWTWSTLSEVTNNILSLFIERSMGVSPSRLKRDNRWPAVSTYLADTSPTKDFNTSTNINSAGPWIRLYMFQQLWLTYGDNFFIQLNKKARVDNPTITTDAAKMRWFMLSACTISGKNLTNFFRKWGFLVSESVYTEIANLNLPQPAIEPSTINEDNVGLIENGATYKLVSAVNNSSVIDLNSYTPVNGTLVSLYQNNTPSTINQQWKLRSAGNGYFTFKSLVDTTKVLDVTGGVSTNGTQIEVYNSNNGNAQKWALKYVGDGYYNLSPACATGSNMDVNGGYSANGTKIQIWTASTANAQKFKLVKQ